MWRLKVLLASCLALSQANIIQDTSGRISGGFPAQQHTPKCFTTLHIEFPNSDISRKCGGCLIGEDKVITTGNCVTTAQDGEATNIQLSFGGKNPSNAALISKKFGVSKISFAPGYDYEVRSPLNNLAILTLNKTVPFNSQLDAAVPYINDTQDAFVDQQLFVCGFGNIDNNDQRPSSLQCTYLTGVPADICLATLKTVAPVDPTTIGPIICTENLDDSNACQGDQGSPVFIDLDGDWKFIGVVSTFTNVRPNSACLDGHNTIITQIGGFINWIATV
jgi:secreted trypsin-like serine protease